MSAPIRYTCPDIDKVIEHIGDALIYISEARDDVDGCNVLSEVFGKLDNAVDKLVDLEDEMEKLRKANDTLRSWGEEQEAQCEEYETEIATLKEEIESLHSSE